MKFCSGWLFQVSRSPFRGKLLGLILLVSLVGTACKKEETSSAPPPTPVELKTLQSTTLLESNDFVGTLQATETVQLKPQAEGRITQVLVQSGDRVTKGTPIFLLTPDKALPEFQSAEATVAQAKAAKDTALQDLKVAQANARSAKAQRDNSQLNYERAEYLVGQGAISNATADREKTQAIADQQAYQASLDKIRAAESSVKKAQADINAAQAQARAASVPVNYKQVVSPVTGFVGNISLKPGDVVSVGQVLTNITNNDAFDLQIPIPISRAGQLRTGLPVQLIDPNTSQLLASGNIFFVDATTDSNAQSIQTRARFANPNGKLRDGQYVKARVLWSSRPGLLVPATAVTNVGSQSFVFVTETSTTDGKTQITAKQIPVQLGPIQGQSYQLISGLKPGQQVVVSGVIKLRNGSPITSQSSNVTSSTKPQS